MDDLSFLDEASERGQLKATLKVVLPDGDVCHLSDRINTFMFLDTCPLLYIAFEDCPYSRLQASVEATSKIAVVSLLRYCYTGTYLPPDAESGPVSLLPHVETYKIAEDFDMTGLQRMAQGNLACQVELALYQPFPPEDLFDTIRFVYRHYSSLQVGQHHCLLSTLLSYCVSVFGKHNFEQHVGFRELATDLPKFSQDLCLENMRREFEDECALKIIQLNLGTLEDPHSVRPTVLASRDLPQEMISDAIPDTPAEPQDSAPISEEGPEELTRGTEDTMDHHPSEETLADSAVGFAMSSLPHRPARTQLPTIVDTDAESSEDDLGFTMVYRPRVHFADTFDEPMSSPEIIDTPVFDMLAASGTPYPDDDWEVLE